MSDSSKFSKYSTKKLSRRNRTQHVPGDREDTNKFYFCQICGFITDIERDTLDFGEMSSDGIITTDFVGEINNAEPFDGHDTDIVIDAVDHNHEVLAKYGPDGVTDERVDHYQTSEVIGGCPCCGSKNWK